jgi:hypothetical protein
MKPMQRKEKVHNWETLRGALDAAVAAVFFDRNTADLPLLVPDANAACDAVSRFCLAGAKLYPADIRP